jgi:predicted dehydrogenase
VTSVRVEVFERMAALGWRIDPYVAGAGLFYDLGSHCVDILDFLLGRIEDVHGVAINTGGAYAAEDVTAAAFTIEGRIAGTGTWNFNAADTRDAVVCTGTAGELHLPVFADADIVVRAGGRDTVHRFRNPLHVHQPLIEAIVGELGGQGRCESTGESAARASRVLEQCVAGYYRHLVSDRIRS